MKPDKYTQATRARKNTHRPIQCRCPDRLTWSINYVVARLLAVLCNEDIWTPDEQCNQRNTLNNT